MICVPEEVMQLKAKSMPMAYLDDCRAVAHVENGQWCFEVPDYAQLRRKYDKYTHSEADPYRERISGCCDRADQY